jgi:glucose-6-phosphate isomerase
MRLQLSPGPTAGEREIVAGWQAVGAARRLRDGDAALWGPEARPEAEQRLGWLDLPNRSRRELPGWIALRDQLGTGRPIVLAGMGGSSLGAELIAALVGVDLTIVDTTDPATVARRLLADPAGSILVVASKSGSTVETDAHRRAFVGAGGASRTVVAITDPGSDLQRWAEENGHHVVFGHADVGGRFSVLSAFGLLPAILAGADPERVEGLLGQAIAAGAELADPEGAAVRLAALLAAAARRGEPIRLPGPPDPAAGFSDWAEQLIAESTGKAGRGVLPVVGIGTTATGPGRGITITGSSPAPAAAATAGGVPAVVDGSEAVRSVIAGPWGAQLLAWEYATALASQAIGVNPFDQPDVQRAKTRTGEVLAQQVEPPQPIPGAPPVSVVGSDESPAAALAELLASVPAGGYLAVLAFLDPDTDGAARQVAARCAASRPDISVTFGWGPRYLHSTGQFHKGGPAVGRFLVLTGSPMADVAVPGRDYDFGQLQWAQALGDIAALGEVAAPVLHLHLADRATLADLVSQ